MKDYSFISFKKVNEQYVAFATLDALTNPDIEKKLIKISSIYTNAIKSMKCTMRILQEERKKEHTMKALTAWNLGDKIFELVGSLHERGFEIDNLYEHLLRDLEINRKWLEKIIILRRYLPNRLAVLSNYTWSYFEKSTRKKAEKLALENAALTAYGNW